MKTYIDRQKVSTRVTLATALSVGGLLLLLASVLLPLFIPATANISLILLAVGGIIAMVGIYYSNRWVRKPRPEDSLGDALKALDDRYRLYHYSKTSVRSFAAHAQPASWPWRSLTWRGVSRTATVAGRRR